MIERICQNEQCGQVIEWRAGTQLANYLKRKFCSAKCQKACPKKVYKHYEGSYRWHLQQHPDQL